MKRIMLINSPLFEEKHDLNKEDYLPPMGLGIIATELRKHDGIHVELIDAIAENKSVTDIIAAISESRSDFVGINIFTTNFRFVKEIIEKTKIKTRFIIGGISTRSLYHEIFKWKTQNDIDIVYGDGELITIDIVTSLVKEKPADQSGTFRFFVISKESSYYVQDISHEKIERKLFQNEPYLNCYGRPEVSIYTSRGCIYNCAYCVAANGINRQLGVRIKKIPHVISELTGIKSLYPSVEYIRVLDDLFLRSGQSFIDASSIFSQFNFSWRAMCHIKPLYAVDINNLINLHSNGCKELFVGIESGSRRILNKIHKETDINVILKATEKVFQSGINLKGYFICGFPSETLQDLEDTIGLAEKIKQQADKYQVVFRTSTFQFRPYHGTELYSEILDKSPHKEAASILFEMKKSDWLSGYTSRKSFNFDSGNYSLVSDSVLQNCIGRMNTLNGIV
jgi:anaerobic magnesium-protoporphyrin IX monomethyl ester cyclase